MRRCSLDGTVKGLVAVPSSTVEPARNSPPASGCAGGRGRQRRGCREGRRTWLMEKAQGKED